MRLAAELIGTFGLVAAGTGAIMADDRSGGRITGWGVALAFGLGVTAMIYATRSVSGAHLNPAVTLALALARRFPWRDLPLYWAAQLSGAVLASLALRLALGPVAQLGSTMPRGSPYQSLGLEILLAFFLMVTIAGAGTCAPCARRYGPLAIGAVVALEAYLAGPISGASMNPARSFGPALVGWHWASHWIYWIGPLLGMAGGSTLLLRVKRSHGDSTVKSQTFVPNG